MNHFEAHLIVSLKKVDSKVLRMGIYLNFLREKDKMVNVILEILDAFFFGTSSDVLTFKSPRFLSGFEF